MSQTVVSQEEFDQAMEELGLVKVCSICDKEVTYGEPHYSSPCRGYGYDPAYQWRRR